MASCWLWRSRLPPEQFAKEAKQWTAERQADAGEAAVPPAAGPARRAGLERR